MKNQLLLVVIGLSLVACNKDEDSLSPGVWNQLKDFPGEVRNSGIAFDLQGKGYWGLGGNSTTSFLRDMWMYDPAADSWTRKNDFPFDLPAVTAVTIGDRGYILTYSGALYLYNPVTDEWKYMSSFPTGSRPWATGFSLGGNAYFGMGNSTVPDGNGQYPSLKDFWKYDPALNKWAQITDFPGIARVDAVSFVAGERGYVGLGFSGQAAPPINKDMWSYDAKTGQWNQIADLPINNTIVGILYSSATKGYVGLPFNDISHQGQMFEYNPVSDAWRVIKTFPSSNSLETHSFTVNNRIFVLGGWWSEISPQVWEFVP